MAPLVSKAGNSYPNPDDYPFTPGQAAKLNGLKDPATGLIIQPATPETHMEPVNPPEGAAKVLAVLKVVATILVLIAGSLIAAAQSGLALPASVISICTALVAIGSGLGIASSGVALKAAEKPKE